MQIQITGVFAPPRPGGSSGLPPATPLGSYPPFRPGTDEAVAAVERAVERAAPPRTDAERWGLAMWAGSAVIFAARAHGDLATMTAAIAFVLGQLAEGAAVLGVRPEDYAAVRTLSTPAVVAAIAEPLSPN